MTATQSSLISLEDARRLVTCLEQGDTDTANDIFQAAKENESVELFSEVGKLTRQLHDSLNNFHVDDKIASLTQEEIPDAQSRLTYVIEETEKAANTTMDAVEKSMPLAENLHEKIAQILPEWQKLMSRQLELGEFKALCGDLDGLLNDAFDDSAKLNSLLTEILMAQGYQDLTGQVIRRVIELVKDVEESLVGMLTAFGEAEKQDNANRSEKETDKVKAEGPIIDAASREDVVCGQDDVDDLLSSLGF